MPTLAPKTPPQDARDVAEALARGLAHHQAGNLQHAEACYREILRVEPAHSDALHLLGVIAQQNGDYPEAERLIRSAIARNPGVADYHNNLGNTYRLHGDLGRSSFPIVRNERAVVLMFLVSSSGPDEPIPDALR